MGRWLHAEVQLWTLLHILLRHVGAQTHRKLPYPFQLEFMEVALLPSGISNGTVTAGVLAGRLGSSTGAELAVGLAALAKPFPVHFASDSRAFCDKANFIIDAPELWPRRPYALQRDGDLWQHFHEGLIAHGPILSESHGIKYMLPSMPFTREQSALTMLCTTALRTMRPAKGTRHVGEMA